MTEWSISYADTPPSMNAAGWGKNPFVTARLKRKWEDIFSILLMEAKLPRARAYIEASATLHFPVKRRRDAGNYTTLIDKALADTLVRGLWIPDDTPEFYRFTGTTFERGPARTIVELKVR